MPRQFLAMVRAELLKTFSRGSGIGSLVVSVLVALAAVAALHWADGMQDSAQFNGQPLRGFLQFDVVQVGGWALYARNFFVLPLLLLFATAASFAGEHADRTLRELVVRPVSRGSILAAKTIALVVLSACGLVLTYVTAVAAGWVAFGPPAIDQSVAEGSESLIRLSLGFLAALLSDLGLIALGLALASFVRSVGGVVVSLVLVLMADRLVWGLLSLASLAGVEAATTMREWTLVSAMGCWTHWEDEFLLSQFGILAAITAAAWGVAWVRFSRSDVP